MFNLAHWPQLAVLQILDDVHYACFVQEATQSVVPTNIEEPENRGINTPLNLMIRFHSLPFYMVENVFGQY